MTEKSETLSGVHLRRFGSPKNAMDFKKNSVYIIIARILMRDRDTHRTRKTSISSSEGAVRMDRLMSPS
jgi:hypothetical protein